MEGLGPKLLRFFVVLSVINLGVASLIWIFHPDLQRSLIKNGYFVQNATAIFFLAGFFLGAIPLIASPDPARRRLYFWIPLLSLFAWLEEIRYGMGYIHFHTLVLEGKKVDAIHDLLNVLQFSLHGIPFHRLIEAAGLVALSLPAFHYRLPNRILDLARADLPYRFFFIAFALGMVGQVLDLKLFPGRYVHLIEEVLEMNGSIAMEPFISSTSSIRCTYRPGKSFRSSTCPTMPRAKAMKKNR